MLCLQHLSPLLLTPFFYQKYLLGLFAEVFATIFVSTEQELIIVFLQFLADFSNIFANNKGFNVSLETEENRFSLAV